MLRLTERNISSSGTGSTQWFDVTVTETLEQIVRVEAHSPDKAEQIAANDWRKQEFVLDAGNFTGVEFKAAPVIGE